MTTVNHAPLDRILVKVSGEALKAGSNDVIDPVELERIATDIASVARHADVRSGMQVVVVVGAGNIWRGKNHPEINQSDSDYNGMVATIINGKALGSALTNLGIDTRVMTALPIDKVCEPYIRGRALRHLEKGRVVICVAGTGNPFCTTDFTAALRASELDCDIIYMGKNGVDGVYDSDPATNPDARKFTILSYAEVLDKGLGVMDLTALTQASDSNIPIVVYNANEPGELARVIFNSNRGTVIAT